jgi:hypothetical protein
MLSFAGKLPQALAPGPPGLPRLVRSRLCEQVQSLASAAVIRAWVTSASEAQRVCQIKCCWLGVLGADHSNSAQQAKDIFQ